MLKTVDRYVIREIIPPFLMAVLIFTFLLQLPPLMQELERLVAKGVSWQTVGQIILLLTPQALGLTIPMGLLVGILIGLGRLSGDREGVALLACGVSPYRLLRPILVLSGLAAAVTLYVMISAIPNSNQRYREILYDIIAKKAESDIRPRVFFDDFPNWVLFPRDETPPGQPGWKDLLVAHTGQGEATALYLARSGRLYLNYEKRQVNLILTHGTMYRTLEAQGSEIYEFLGDYYLTLDPNTIFPPMELPRGVTEKTIAQLQQTIAEKRAAKPPISPHPEIIAIHQKFSIPAACLVFGVIGLALGLSVAREGKFSGFVVGIAVIFAYYTIMFLVESATKGHWLPAEISRWVPNLILGPLGILALVWRARHTDGRLPFRVPIRLPLWPRLPGPADPSPPRTTAAGAVKPAPTARRGVVIVVRVPRLSIPSPLLIDRYISRIYLRVVGLSFLGLLGLFYISTFIDKSDKIFKGQASLADVTKLLVFQTPLFVYYIIPIAALLSVLVTFGLLSRSSELTVMKACGISLYRASASLVLLALVFSAVLFGLEQKVLARANRRAEIIDAQIRGRPPRTFSALNRQWALGRDGDIYHYAYFDPNRAELNGLTIYETDPETWKLRSQTFVKRAAFVNGVWRADSGWAHDFTTTPPSSAALPARALPRLEPPDYFATDHPLAEMMTVAQLRTFIKDLSASGLNAVPWAVELQRKLAFPFVTLVMTLLAVPFGVSTGRRGTLYGIGLGIVLALSYWIVSSAFVAIGHSGLLTPFLAGWAPNILTLGLAGYLLLQART
jgi:LPS export ABC transporter permease LptG/LPS export ABC transporter permease LptF